MSRNKKVVLVKSFERTSKLLWSSTQKRALHISQLISIGDFIREFVIFS